MPILGSKGSLSATKFGFLSQVVDIGAPYWIGTFTSSIYSTPSNESGLFVDSLKNLYIVGKLQNAVAAKYNSSGTIQWQREVGLSRGSALLLKGSGLTSGDVLISGTSFISKWSTSGSISLQRELYSSIYSNSVTSLEADSSGNLYALGSYYLSFPRGSFVKYDSSGSLLLQRDFYNGTSNFGISSSRFHDGTSSVYLNGRATLSTTTLVKYSSTGTVTWQRCLVGINQLGIQGGVDCDSSGNVYATYNAYNGTVTQLLLVKYNSSGTLIWQRVFSAPAGESVQGASDVAVDSSGNIFTSGYYYDSVNNKNVFFVVKVDPSGTTLFARDVAHSTASYEHSSRGVAVDSSGAFYVMLRLYNALRGYLFLKLPSTGAKTGTYSIGGASVTYSASSVTSSTSTYIDSAGLVTSAAGGLTDAALSLSPSTPSYTSTVVTI